MKGIICALILSAATAITGKCETWTYARCVEYARLHNIDLQKTALQQTAAACDLELSRAQWEPTLDFSTAHGFTNNPLADNNRNSLSGSLGFNAGWTVWNGGIRKNTILRDEVNEKIAALNFDDAFRTLETDMLQVYLNILYAREAIAIYSDAVNLSEAQTERARMLMEAGRASKVDYAQLKAQYEQNKFQLVDATGTYNTRRLELKELLELGIDADIEPDSVTWSDETTLANLPPIEESYILALDTDARIKALNLEKDAAAIDVEIAKGEGKPTISLNASAGTSYGVPGSFGSSLKNSLGESIGININIPILNQKKSKIAEAKAKINELDALFDIDARTTEIAHSIENWYIQTVSAQSRYQAALQQVEAASLSNELVNEQFNVGLVNTVELMTAHNNLLEARHSLLQAKYMAVLGRKMIEFLRTSTITDLD